MDLDEYLFYKQKKDPTYTYRHFADEVGISLHQLWAIRKKRGAPSAKTMYLIDKHTNRTVDVMEMVREFFEKSP